MKALVKAMNLPIFVFRSDEEDAVDTFWKPNKNRIVLKCVLKMLLKQIRMSPLSALYDERREIDEYFKFK